MTDFDFDRYLTERTEAREQGRPRSVRFADREWILPPAIPGEPSLPGVFSFFIGGQIRSKLEPALRSVFGDQMPDLLALGLDEDEYVTLINKVLLPALQEDPETGPNSDGSSEPDEPTSEP